MQNPENEQIRDDDAVIPVEDDEQRMTSADTVGAEAGAPGAGAEATDALARELDEQRDRYLRLAAEFDNFRKRMTKERAEAGPRAQAELARQLLEPIDDLMRFAHLDPAQVDSKTVIEGAGMVEKKVLKAFGSAGITQIDPLGEPFDPNLHEALTTEPAASAEEDHTVSRVFQVGYLANGQLLRPARVIVKQWNG